MMTEEGNAIEVTFDKFVFRIPRGDRYTQNDLWVRREAEGFRIGLTDFAQRLAGDMALVQLSPMGSAVAAGDELALLETIKAVVAVEAPVAGRVVAVHDELVEHPEWINEDPYSAGWLVVFAPDGEWPGLLDAQAYAALMGAKLADEDRKRSGKS